MYTVTRSAQVTMGYYICWSGWLFDRRHGTDTSGFIEHPNGIIGNNAIHGTGYGPTPPNTFHRIMRKLNMCFVENNISAEALSYTDFTFVDFGAGKGRVVLLALEFGFKKVIGIEYSSLLYNIILNNVESLKTKFRKTPPTELFCFDAEQFKFDKGNKILYFYNPFNENITEKILKKLWDVAEDESSPPIVYAVYIPDRTPNFDVFLRCGFVMKKRLRWRDYAGLRRDALIFQMMPLSSVGAK
jgi:hypothetical protein